MNRRDLSFSQDAREALTAYTWPGNARELQNAVERAVVMCGGHLIQAKDLPGLVTAEPRANQPAPGSLAEMEKAHVLRVLDASEWNISQAARILGVDRVTIYNKIKKYELKKPAMVPEAGARERSLIQLVGIGPLPRASPRSWRSGSAAAWRFPARSARPTTPPS